MEGTINLKHFNKNKLIKNTVIVLLGILLALLNPFKMDLNQRIVLSSLLVVISWWTTGYLSKNIACVFLLLMFILFGNTAPYEVIKFAFSPSFYLIVFSFLLSEGISNSKAADRLASLILERYGKSPIKLVILSFLFGIALIFIIPQPFSRVILLASIYGVFLDGRVENEKLKEILIFSIFLASTTTSMLFINGDIILNFSALEFGGVNINAQEWIHAMLLPSIITNIIIFAVFILLFKKEIWGVSFGDKSSPNIDQEEREKSGKKVAGQEVKAAIIMLLVVALWLTEGLHGINATYVALIGVVLMFASRILTSKDLKSINFGLLLFLITAFAIGTVMKESGVSNIIFTQISRIMPGQESSFYLLSMVLIVMALHMVIGSSITTLSVAVPSLVLMTEGMVNPLIVVLLSYISVNIHYIVPFQHVTIMIGSANKLYKDKLVMKFGLLMTILTLLIIGFVYIPWWKLIGLI